MLGESSTVGTGAPNLNLNAEEKRVYGQLFLQADSDGVGVVTGDVAVQFFERTRLDSKVLGEIWQIADKENRGFLDPTGFGIVLRLIGHAQAGRDPTAELALKQGPLPRFDGFTPSLPPPPPGPPPLTLQSQATGAAINRIPPMIPPLTPEKVAQYAALFERQPLQNGNMLPGDQAKQIFEKSGLPNDILARIWILADTERRGALVLTEFVIAMHLLTSMKTGNLRQLPDDLPAALYEAATRRHPIPRQQSPTTATPPVSAIPRQLSGQAPLTQMRTGSPLGRPLLAGPPLAAQTTGDWVITPPDKARFDQLYAELDKTNKGYISGEEAVPFFSQSNLPEDTLAQIWDLADIRSQGRLNKDEFAIAMYLIRQQRNKRDGPSVLPSRLPPNLVPPSMRSQIRPPTATSISSPSPFDAPGSGPAPAAPAQPKPSSALDDLFGLDASSPPPPAPSQVAVGTGGSNTNDPFSRRLSPPAPSSPIKPSPAAATFKPFVPSSSFGRNLLPQGTGGSNSSAPGGSRAPVQPMAAEDDLLGDNDPEISSKLSSETTELANLSNQIGSLSKQMQDVQEQRANAERELNRASAEKKDFEERLARLRTLYEQEAKAVRFLEQQLNASRNETKKLETEIATLQATYEDLQKTHEQVMAALQADQRENTSLKERIRTVNAEVAQLKPQIEKLKSEARQQKGLVAINKKQLATNEGERDKLKTEVEDLTKSNEELARQISSSSPVPTQMASPALSATTANNPFFRRTGSTDLAGAFASPTLKAFSDKSFDDVFGPSFPTSSQTSTPPPAPPMTTFKPQTTGTSTGSVTSFATPVSTSPNASRQPTLAAEPAALPESRQISSSALPFVDVAESLSSSRQVSPPMSRLGQLEAPAAVEQPIPITSPVEPPKLGQSLTSGSGSDLGKSAVTVAPLTEGKPMSNGTSAFFATTTPVDEALKTAQGGSVSDPFAVMDNQAKAKEDFESAFASFKNAQVKVSAGSGSDTAKTFSGFNAEFPPISELERDEDSDSDIDQAGFDDDFAPASPPAKMAEKSVESSKPSSPAVSKALPAQSPASPGANSAAGTEQLTTSDKPSSPAPVSTSITSIIGPNVDDIFGSSLPHSPPLPATSAPLAAPTAPATAPPAPATTSKGAFDDLDDDFEGLEDAKEGSADDDFANISRSGLDDFNPVFDSSPPPSQAAKSESATTNAAFGVESSFDFASLSGASTTGSTTAAGTSGGASGTGTGTGTGAGSQAHKGSSQPDPHDWDAIFAGLDDSASAASPSAPTAGTAGAVAGNGSAKEPARTNGPGRVLTEGGEHDDQNLKNLTSMGYSRADALSALEKYDYNLERAANYLVANQS